MKARWLTSACVGTAVALGIAVGDVAAAVAPLSFQDVTASSGIRYSGPSFAIAWGDANGDTLPDLYVGNHGKPHNLFFGDGQGRFVEAAAGVLPRPRGDAHGAAWADFDNDGDQDLVELIGAAVGTATNKANRLFVNQGGVFEDQAVTLGINDPLGRGRWPLWFDWDNDGRLDLLVMNAPRADAPSILFHRVSNSFQKTSALGTLGSTKYALLGSFKSDKRHIVISGQPFPLRIFDANQLNPLPFTDLRTALSMPLVNAQVMDAALFDFNGDGLDDLFEITGAVPSDATISAGQLLSRLQLETGGTKGFDFGASGTISVLITPRAGVWWKPKVVYIGSAGTHPGAIPFKLSPSDPGVDGLATPTGSKGVYIGYDRKSSKWQVRMTATGYEEGNIVVTASGLANLSTVGFSPFVPRSRPVLLVSSGNRYNNVSDGARLTTLAPSNCFSVTAADFDNDGDLDVFAACSGPLAKQGVENELFRNIGDGTFALVENAGGVSRPTAGVADGVAAADFDMDGFVDIALTNGQGSAPFNVGPTQVFRNTSGESGNFNHWLEVDLVGTRSNKDGVGARVVLTANGWTQSRLQRNGMHKGGQDYCRMHFGLGSSTSVQSLNVLWPSGTSQVLNNVPPDRVIRVREPL